MIIIKFKLAPTDTELNFLKIEFSRQAQPCGQSH